MTFVNTLSDSLNNNKSTMPTSVNKPVQSNIYTKDENKLKQISLDEKEEYSISALDVYYALVRLSDLRVFDYPFYAIKNPKGEGYIGIISGIKNPSGNDTGEAIFLIPYRALNQTKKMDLEKSIKAINGLALIFNANLQYAKGYDYFEVMDWIEK